MRKAVIPISYIIALIFGIIALAVLGYWLYTQSGKIIGTGSKTECDAKQYTFCQQWKSISIFSSTLKPPLIGFPAGCPDPDRSKCMELLSCKDSSSGCNKQTEDEYFFGCDPGYGCSYVCCRRI